MRTSSGFTLPELVATLVIIGILAAVVVPRFANRADFDAFGFAAQTRQTLQFAQKAAIAKRRTVCVNIFVNASGKSQVDLFLGACGTNLLQGPDGNPMVLIAPDNVTITDVAANPVNVDFTFDALGRPNLANTLVLNVMGGSVSKVITVEAETGYVH